MCELSTISTTNPSPIIVNLRMMTLAMFALLSLLCMLVLCMMCVYIYIYMYVCRHLAATRPPIVAMLTHITRAVEMCRTSGV